MFTGKLASHERREKEEKKSDIEISLIHLDTYQEETGYLELSSLGRTFLLWDRYAKLC